MNNIEIRYLFLIVIICIAACIETDIYLPAFPDMMQFFNVSEEQIQGILTWNFVGICLSGPLYGPVSDAFGRKTPLLVSLGLFLVGSVLTIIAQDFNSMLLGRFLQGLGSGGCFTICTAIIFDAFQAEKAIKAINQLNLIIPLIMSVAPIAGGYLNIAYGFRSNFILIAALVMVGLLATLTLFDETHPKEKRSQLKISSVAKDFKSALTHSGFWQLTLVVSLVFAGYIAFLSGISVLFVVELGISKQMIPLYQAAILGAWLAASLTCHRMICSVGILTVKYLGTAFVAMGGIGFPLLSWWLPTDTYLLTGFMLLYAFGGSWLLGLYFPEGMELLPDIKGITSSILTSLRLLISAMAVGCTSVFYDGTIFPIAYMVFGITLVILLLVMFYERQNSGVVNPTTAMPHH